MWGVLWLLAFASGTAQAAAPVERLLDDFEDLATWRIEASEGVTASLRAAPGRVGAAMCLDFDFGRVSGYALARRQLPLEFPADFELAFDVRGDALANALQVKLVDASGENVWWREQRDFRPPHEWQPMRIRKRQVSFAWGPAKDHALARTESIEFAVARGEGGQGSVCFDRLALRERTVATGLADRFAAGWRSDPAKGREQELAIDLGGLRDFGGLVLRWLPGMHASRYEVDLSDDGHAWREAWRVRNGRGGREPILLTESEARHLRLRMHDGPAGAYGLEALELRDTAFGATPNAFFEALAHDAPRGHYPRGFSGEQPYWTVVGIDGGTAQGLLSEDGALEARTGEAAIEPMLLTDAGLVTWADATISQSLDAGYLPIPTVAWRRGDLALRVTAFGMGTRERSQLVARYTVENSAARAQSITLVLALRPFQVNPPRQFLNAQGGVAPMKSVGWNGDALTIEGAARVWPLQRPSEALALPFEAGNLPDVLAGERRQWPSAVEDPTGFPSAALLYRLEIPAHGARSVGLVVPLAGEPMRPAGDAVAWMAAEERKVAREWTEKLDRVGLRVPDAGRRVVDTVRTALAHILIERNGAALQPGTRSYARTWIRDGAMMSDALLRMGHAPVVREFADWFEPHLFASGKVPCCADRRGADPVPENDSHGEWIHLVAEYHRYSRDTAWLRGRWPGVSAAWRYMERLREEGRAMKDAAALSYAGLMPPSISHEGYSDRPAWSYWDDAWALAGYRSAQGIASVLGREDDARALARDRESFVRDLLASIGASRERHHITFIPGSADRGDFDATSTTVALSPGGQAGLLPREWLDATFERYWREFTTRRDGTREWEDYTPYEVRNIGAFVRLGWRRRAAELVDYFMADRRPAAWNQWAEVVGREARKPRFVGDMPHGWVAGDFIRSALDLFAYERESDGALVLAAGVPPAWLEGAGIELKGLRTPWGRLSYTLRREGGRNVLRVPAASAMPPGGLVVGNTRITTLPARVAVELPAGP